VASAIIVVFAVSLHPKKEMETNETDGNELSVLSGFAPPAKPEKRTPGDWFDFSPVLNIFFAMMGAGYLFFTFYTKGFNLTLNNVNLMFLTLGIIFHKTPASLLAASKEASKTLHGIVLQFPLYAGIYGIIKDSGLATQISHFFSNISSTGTFPGIVCWYSSILNYFVPSGGSKWAIEAPYLIEAANSLGVGINKVAISYAIGDMSSNLIQPFWSIPLLSVVGLKFKDILGYEILFFVMYIVVASAAILIFL
jgi:short-chain fatty acids transporter